MIQVESSWSLLSAARVLAECFITRRLQYTIILAASVLFSAPLSAQQVNGAIDGYCNLGKTTASLSGMQSVNTLQGIAPSCTVTVYLSGTVTLATIYSNVTGTPLSNPFTANSDGSWLAFASINNLYDVTLSGGTAPNNYPSPKTITGLAAQFAWSSGIYPIPAGTVLTSAIIAAACPGSTPGALLLPVGTVTAATSLAFPSNCTLQGQGPTASILSVSNGSAIASAIDMNGITNDSFRGFTLQCASSPATCTTGIRIRYSTNVILSDMVISGGGYGAGSAPRAQVYTEDDDNVSANQVRLVNSGGVYEWVNGYFGLPSTRIFLNHINDENNLSADALTMFNCQWCRIDNTYVNQNNQIPAPSSDGYPILWYSTGSGGNSTTFPISTCTGSNTITCTVPLSGGGTTQLPVGTSFQCQTVNISGGTGTLNGTWDCTLLSSTTFSFASSGANASGATFASAAIFYPTAYNVTDTVTLKNSAGTGIYMQGCQHCSVSHWNMENIAQQQTTGALPIGCIAINGGYSLSSVAVGDAIGPGVCDGSAQNGIDFANTQDLSVGGGITLRNITGTALRDFSGSNGNANFDIGGNLTINGAAKCYSTSGSGTPHGGSVGPFTCSNFTTGGLFPNLGGINFRNITLNPATNLPCIDDFVSGNNYYNVICNGGNNVIAGSNTKIIGGGVFSTTATHAVSFIGAQHIFVSDFTVDTATQGLFFINSGGTQPSDITIKNSHIIGLTTQPALWDQAPAAVTITTHTSTTVDISATGAFVAAGMGLGDYGSGGNNDIPLGTTITGGPYTCSSGCSVTISQAATGSHTAETGLLQGTMESGINIWDTDAQGNGINSQGALFYGMQNLDLERLSISGFTTVGLIDLRGQTNVVKINGGIGTGSSNVAVINIPGGVNGSAQGVSVSNFTFAGTATNAYNDNSKGTGNVWNNFTNTFLGGLTPTYLSTSASTAQGVFTVSFTPSATAANVCVEQTKSLTAASGQLLQVGQAVQVTPPSANTHVTPTYARAASSNTLAVMFCGDGTGGTAPSGNWIVQAR